MYVIWANHKQTLLHIRQKQIARGQVRSYTPIALKLGIVQRRGIVITHQYHVIGVGGIVNLYAIGIIRANNKIVGHGIYIVWRR